MTTLAAGTDTFGVFGTTATLLVSEPGRVAQARAIADAELAAVDLACSRFRPDSELARLNAARGAAISVSDLFADLVEAALRAARLTDGDVDPTCGQALEEIGYDRDFALLQAGERPPRPRPASRVPGWRSVRLDRERRLVRLSNGAQLDLGATAKAWAADHCAGLIAARPAAASWSASAATSRWPGPPPERRLAGAGHRRSRGRTGDARADGDDPVRRAGHLEHHRAHLGRGRPARASHHRPGHRRARPVLLAHGQRGRRELRRRQHRQHRGDHPGRGGRALAGRRRAARPPGRRGRVRARLPPGWPSDPDPGA